jgi:predicted membrane protein
MYLYDKFVTMATIFSLYSIKNINRFVFVMEGTVFFVRYTLNPYMLLT